MYRAKEPELKGSRTERPELDEDRDGGRQPWKRYSWIVRGGTVKDGTAKAGTEKAGAL